MIPIIINTAGFIAFLQKGLVWVELPSCVMAPPVQVNEIYMHSTSSAQYVNHLEYTMGESMYFEIKKTVFFNLLCRQRRLLQMSAPP
jgi:hypothetical protein